MADPEKEEPKEDAGALQVAACGAAAGKRFEVKKWNAVRCRAVQQPVFPALLGCMLLARSSGAAPEMIERTGAITKKRRRGKQSVFIDRGQWHLSTCLPWARLLAFFGEVSWNGYGFQKESTPRRWERSVSWRPCRRTLAQRSGLWVSRVPMGTSVPSTEGCLLF